MPTSPQVRVGVGVFVLKSTNEPHDNPSFLIARRKGSHGAGKWALPGGHLEFGETVEQCAAREVQEETGLEVKNVTFLTATNDYMPDEGKHYVTMFTVCTRVDEGVEARTMEPKKSEDWEWMTWEEMKAKTRHQMGENETRKLFTPWMTCLSSGLM